MAEGWDAGISKWGRADMSLVMRVGSSFMLDLKIGFVDHTFRESTVAGFRRRKRDRAFIDVLASRSNVHPCFRVRRVFGAGSSHDGDEVTCRVGRNDRQGNGGKRVTAGPTRAQAGRCEIK